MSGARSIALSAVLALVVAAACGPAAVTPSNSPGGTPGPQATARASARAATASPTVTPTADPGRAAVNAFVALVTTKNFSYQGTFTGNSRHTADILPISNGVLQVSGTNAFVRASFTFPDKQRYTVEHRSVGGKAWIREVPGRWIRMTFKAADSMAAFAAVRSAADVTYLGPKIVAGKTLYEVELRSAIVNPIMIPATNLTEGVVTSPRLRLLIDAAGKPVRGTAEIDGRGRISGQLQEIVIDLTVTFTKVGQAIKIQAP